MFIYLLPVIHLSLLIFGLVTSENSTNITVQVSVNGSDTPSCIQNNTSCKTMLYVLDRISHMSKYFHQNTNVTVNVACNQSILFCYMPYKFASSFPLSIRLIGHNNTSIVFKGRDCLTINQESESEFNWAWIGFTIFSFIAPSNSLRLSENTYENINSLTILNCKIRTTTLTITNAHNVVIDSTEIGGAILGGNSLCPSISVTTVSHSTSITLSNNNFSTCTLYNHDATSNIVSFDITKPNSYLTITKCVFTEVIGYHDDKFNNQVNTILLVNMQKLIHPTLTIDESRFIRNSEVKLLTVNALPEIGLYHVSVLLHRVVIIKNTATSSLVEINRNTISAAAGLFSVTLSNLSVDGNHVGNKTDWSQAVGGLASSVFSFSKVLKVIVTNSNFTNNHGTPLKFKSDQLGESFLFGGYNTFSNNTGVFGGACNLQNILFQRDEGTVIFENNKGIYGGALYLANIILPMRMCELRLKFISNKAVTSGNSVYFATSPQGTMQQCPFNTINLIEVNSIALTMTQAEETALQLTPGQNIFINISITDYFGNPSSCTADVYLLCNELLYGCFEKQVSLNGPDHVALAQTDITTYTVVDTKLSVSAPQMLENTAVSLLFICRNNAQIRMVVPLNISSCPLGFVYKESEGVCKCAGTANYAWHCDYAHRPLVLHASHKDTGTVHLTILTEQCMFLLRVHFPSVPTLTSLVLQKC